jgi:hypothetical protein
MTELDSFAPDGFEEFWKAYPRKVHKRAALLAFLKLTPEEAAAAIRTIGDHVKAWVREGRQRQFIPHPATWLNGGCWEDEIELTEEKPPERAIAWWASDEGVMSKGRELGVNARGGESMVEYKTRVVEAARRAA